VQEVLRTDLNIRYVCLALSNFALKSVIFVRFDISGLHNFIPNCYGSGRSICVLYI
jgi:hypothetical protein